MKKLLALALTITAVSALSACTGPIPELVVADELDTEQKISIDFWHQSTLNDDGTDPYQDYIDSFEAKYTNITVTPTTKESYGGLSTAVEAGIAARKYPNLTLGYSNNFVEYMQVNAVADLTGFINHEKYGFKTDDINDFKNGGFWSDNQVYDDEGTIYSLSLAKSSEAAYVNMTMLREYLGTGTTKGWSDSTIESKLNTWEGVYEISQALKDAGSSVYQWHHDTTANWAIALLNQGNVDYTTFKDGKGVINFIDDSMDDAKDLFQEYIVDNSDLVNIRATSGAYGSGQLMDQKWDSATSGLVPSTPSIWMNLGSSSAGNYYDNRSFDLYVTGTPQMATAGSTNYSILQGPSMAMLVHADEQENLATWLFMQHLLEEENQISIAQDTGYMPVRYSAQTDYTFTNWLANEGTVQAAACQAGLNQRSYYAGTPAFIGSNETRNAVGAILDSLLGNTPATLDKAFADAKTSLILYV